MPKKINRVKQIRKPVDDDMLFLAKQKKLYYSGFCLTDNMDFALFYIDRKFIIDNNIKIRLNEFTLSENDLEIEIDRENKIVPEKGVRKFKFENVGLVSEEIIQMFYKLDKEATFYKIKRFFGKETNTLFIVLSGEFGKPIGLIKAKN